MSLSGRAIVHRNDIYIRISLSSARINRGAVAGAGHTRPGGTGCGGAVTEQAVPHHQEKALAVHWRSPIIQNLS
jgi:hypothetical protein